MVNSARIIVGESARRFRRVFEGRTVCCKPGESLHRCIGMFRKVLTSGHYFILGYVDMLMVGNCNTGVSE